LYLPAISIALVLALGLGGCGGGDPSAHSSATGRLPPDYVPVPVGPGPRYRPALRSARVRAANPVGGLRCAPRLGRRFGAHLELFAHQRVVAIPAGIGLTPPLILDGGVVRRARCYYPALTADPTGVIKLSPGSSTTLGELFDLWGQPLGPRVMAGFRAPAPSPVTAFVNGRRWRANPRAIPLSHHARITLELASHILPHRVYLFPPGL
jgi:hypothetical protein